MFTDLLIILLLILFNGVFSMTEIALVSARKSKLETLAREGNRNAKIALLQAHSPSRFLSTVQIGMTLIGAFTGVYGGSNVADKISAVFSRFPWIASCSKSISMVLVVVVITFFTMILGELVPKQIGLANPELISKNMVRPMKFFGMLVWPVIWILTKTSDLLIKLLNIHPSSDSKVTEEEIKEIVQEGTKEGEVQEIEQDIVERVFNLGDRKVGSLMTHRSDLVWLNVDDSSDKIKKIINMEAHSVYPVCDRELDNLKGIVYVKDILASNLENKTINLHNCMRKPLLVLETNTAYEILEKFRETKIHYGLVVDEYGSIAGMVTLNDILEALVGDIPDMGDDEFEIIQRDENSWLVDGQLPFYEFIQEFKVKAFDKNKVRYNTIGGFVLNNLRHIPKTGEKLKWKNFEFEIVDMDGNRIDKILVTKMPEEISEEEDQTNV